MRFLFWKALIGLVAYDCSGFGHDFSKMHRFVRNFKVSARPTNADAIDRVCAAVNNGCLWYPKKVLCLQRSVVTACLLRRYGVKAQLVIGAQKLPFKAHAWVEVAEQVVNERTNVSAIYGVLERC